jgi:chromosome partitioning protein
MTRVLTVANQKGGVGKTTTAVNMGAALAQADQQVLVIDLDPQGNASTALGVAHHEGVPGIYEVLCGDRSLISVLQECPDVPGLWLAPATIDLAGAEVELVGHQAREHRLAKALGSPADVVAGTAGEFDFVLIDCPPSLGLLTLNALVAAREVLLPIQCEYYALEGLSQLLRTVEMVRTHLNPRLEVGAILLTMYDGRTRLASQVTDEVRSHFGARVLQTVIPRAVRVSEAPSFGQTVLTYDPSSPGALTYRQAAAELLAMGGPSQTREG